MTTRTAAEALEEVLAQIAAVDGLSGMDRLEARLDSANAARNFIMKHAATLRAALAQPQKKGNTPISDLLAKYSAENCDFTDLPHTREVALRYVETMPDSHVRCLLYVLAQAQPQEGGSSETPRYDALEPRHKDWDDQGANWSRVKIDELLCDTLSALFDSETELARLLRATQSNGPASVQTPSRDGAESTAGLSQSAPAQEPVATLRVERAKNGRLRNWLDGEWQRNLPVGEYPLYAAPQPDKPCPHIVTTGTTSHCSLAERDARDAARYRWLRQQHEVKWEGPVPDDAKQTWFVTAWNGEVPGCLPGELDAAIDAAIKEQADATGKPPGPTA